MGGEACLPPSLREGVVHCCPSALCLGMASHALPVYALHTWWVCEKVECDTLLGSGGQLVDGLGWDCWTGGWEARRAFLLL